MDPLNQDNHGLVGFSKRIIWPLGVLLLVILIGQMSPIPLAQVCIVLFPAVIIACAVSPAARVLEKRRVPRAVTILGIYLLIVLIFAGVVALLVPIIIDEGNALKAQLPSMIEHLQQTVARFSPEQAQRLSKEELAKELSSVIGSVTVELSKLVAKVFTLSIQLMIVLVVAFFLAVDDKKGEQIIRRFVPSERQETTLRVGSHICKRIGEWVRAQLLLALFFGVAFGAGLWIAGVRHAFTLGLVGVILETIPFVGGFVTLGLALLIALTQSPLLALWVAGVYVVVVQVQGHVLAPKIMDRVVGINPLLAVIAIFAGSETMGVLGAFFALPVVIVLQACTDELFPLPAAPIAPPAEEPVITCGHTKALRPGETKCPHCIAAGE